jgi:hypothetical protein
MDADETPHATSLLRVSDAEIRAAKHDWLTARDAQVNETQVELLFGYYRMLISIQAQEIADEFRARHPRH